MVHWGRPTTPAMARQHKLQLALLLEMDKKEMWITNELINFRPALRNAGAGGYVPPGETPVSRVSPAKKKIFGAAQQRRGREEGGF